MLGFLCRELLAHAREAGASLILLFLQAEHEHRGAHLDEDFLVGLNLFRLLDDFKGAEL